MVNRIVKDEKQYIKTRVEQIVFLQLSSYKVLHYVCVFTISI